MKAHKIPFFTIEEYIQREEVSEIKNEYHKGEIFALAGGTLNHGLLCGNIYSEIRKKLEGKDSKCVPFTSEVKVFINKSKSFVYPDSMVICGEIEQAEEDKNSVTNPILIVEVLSKSTAEYDRGDKFHLYRNLLSFKEYVLIEQRRHIVDVHFKPQNSDLWRIVRYEGLDKIINLESIGIEIEMKELYFNINIDLP